MSQGKEWAAAAAVAAMVLGAGWGAWAQQEAAQQGPRSGQGAGAQAARTETLMLPGQVPLELVWIEGGTFQMGCSAGDDKCEDDEKPAHKVQVDGFWMGKYEVTQRQWQAVMRNNPSRFSDCGLDCPVENVSWEEVQQFLERAGQGLRLPMEAQWEYAARGGASGARYGRYGELEETGWYAWYNANTVGQTERVGQKNPNGYGLYDMLGNVWEWTADWYGTYRAGAEENPTGPSSGQNRVARGGSWNTSATNCRVSLRIGGAPDVRNGGLGFRLARAAQ